MPRQPRIHHPLAVYHVMSRGVDRRDIFHDDADRRVFLGELRAAFKEHGTKLFVYCLMSNHYHLVASVTATPLGIPMQQALSRYSTRYNKAHQRMGHLFEARYLAIACESEAYLIRLAAYIHLNPVRAGICRSPEEWAWSSHAELISGVGDMLDLPALSEATGMSGADLKASYLERVEELMRPLPKEASLSELVTHATLRTGVTPENLRAGRHGDAYTRAKLTLLTLCEKAGYSDAELARELNCSQAALNQLRRRKLNKGSDPFVKPREAFAT